MEKNSNKNSSIGEGVMISQDKQINTKEKKKNSLPVNTDNEKVNHNCMRLYLYLLSISAVNWQENRRQFRQTDFTINKIHESLKMHSDTIIKYWELLEQSGWVKYEGPHTNKPWKEEFKNRKKNKLGYYSLKKDQLYRLIPKETVLKVQNQYMITEDELKLYLLLANLQERTLYYKQNCSQMSLKDLCDLRKISVRNENKKKLIIELLWLKTIGLINFDFEKIKNNFGSETTIINLRDVYYYTNGGELGDILDNEESIITEDLKTSILNSKELVNFED